MRYAVVINLDYGTQDHATLGLLWQQITDRMLEAGFRRDGRTFTIDLPEPQAIQLAGRVIEDLEARLERYHEHVYRYLKDFYGYPLGCTTNLLVPGATGVEVQSFGQSYSH